MLLYMLLYTWTVYVTVYVTIYVTVYVTVYVTPTSQLSAAVRLWKQPTPQLLAKSYGTIKSSSKLSQLISVEVKASEDKAKNIKGK